MMSRNLTYVPFGKCLKLANQKGRLPILPNSRYLSSNKGANPGENKEKKEQKEGEGDNDEASNISSLGHPPAGNLRFPFRKSRHIVSALGDQIDIPDVDAKYSHLPDALSFARKIGVVVPSENTVIEYDLWKMVFSNRNLKGVGFHVSCFHVDLGQILATDEYAEAYSKVSPGVVSSIELVKNGLPEYMIYGCSLEPWMRNVKSNEAFKANCERMAGVNFTTSAVAFPAALKKFNAKSIAILAPYGKEGTANTMNLFQELGFNVVAIRSLNIPSADSIAHIQPKILKEIVLQDLNKHGVEAIIQSGTAMSFVEVAEEIEQEIGKPVIPINSVLLWHALRETGINNKLFGSTRLLREF
jgi:maleate isomerase